jgi:hypothetical protein
MPSSPIRRLLLAAGATLTVAAFAAPASASTQPFHGRLNNSFAPTAPAPQLTLDLAGKGHASLLGKVTDHFTVVIDFDHPVAPGVVLVSKSGSLYGQGGDRLDLSMVGTFDTATFDVHYVFVITGGAGRFAGAGGNGTYHVPPPLIFDPATGIGSGIETFRGTITLPD